MTDHPDPLDELASALLDGDASTEDVARLDAEPELQERVARLAATRDAIRSEMPAVAEERREAAIQAALAAYDAIDTPIVTPIASAPSRRRSTRTLQLVGAAAVLALVALVVPLLGRLDDGSRGQVTGPETASDAFRSSAGGSADSTLEDGGANTLEDMAGEEAFTAPAASSDLGAFDDLPALTDAVRADLAGSKTADQQPAATGGSTPVCPAEPDAEGVVVYRAFAVLDGRDVVAQVREDPDGGRTLVVLDRQDCSRVAGGKL